MSVHHVPTDVLLASIAARDVRPERSIQDWLLAEKLVPGSTRVPSKQLFDRYWAYMRNHRRNMKCLRHKAWGQYMRTKFAWGRAAYGYYYCIQTESESGEVPE